MSRALSRRSPDRHERSLVAAMGITSLALLAALPVHADDPRAREIMERVDARDDGDDQTSRLDMILIDKRENQRVRELLSFAKDVGEDTYTMLFFLSPADVKDTGFLTYDYDDESRDDDQWLFLPALRKTKRIASGDKSGSFMGSDFTYAIGRLTLWSPRPEGVAQDGTATLRAADFRHLAIANPALAPYGVAAQQTLRALGLLEALSSRLVFGENVGQAHAQVVSGGAELGLLALSQVLTLHAAAAGSRWDVPEQLHESIRQDVVLLTRAEDNSVARRFLAFLRSPEARGLIARHGYRLPEL